MASLPIYMNTTSQVALATWLNTHRWQSVAVVVGFVRAFHRHVDVIRLVFAELGELGANAAEVEASHHLIEMLRQNVHLFGVFVALGEQLDLDTWLVKELITKLG